MRSRPSLFLWFTAAVAALTWQVPASSQGAAFDLVIRGGRVVDGTGSPWFVADVGIKGDTITAVAPRLDAGGATIIDAQGERRRRLER